MSAAPDPLFAERVPEAAARQLATVLAWLTECQLATLEDLLDRKKPRKSEIARQTQICAAAVNQCFDLGIRRPMGLSGHPCPRLSTLLESMEADFTERASAPAAKRRP